MSQKGITINTTDAGHVDASDHALLFSAIFGMNGILNVGSKMEISKQSDNKIRINVVNLQWRHYGDTFRTCYYHRTA